MTDCFLSGNVPSATGRVLSQNSVGAGEKIQLRDETGPGVGHLHAQGHFCPICRVATRKRRFLLHHKRARFPDGQTDFVCYRRPSFSPWFDFIFSGELVLVRGKLPRHLFVVILVCLFGVVHPTEILASRAHRTAWTIEKISS